MVTSYRLTSGLTQLHERHVWRVNDAVARGEADAALQRMSDDYSDAALQLLTDALGPDLPRPR